MAKTKPLRVKMDGKGSVEIRGLTRGEIQMRRLARELEIEGFQPLNLLHSAIRADGLDEAARERIRARAQKEGWTLEEVDELPPPKAAEAPKVEAVSTVEALQQHTLSPTRREKLLIPIILLAVGAVVVYAGTVVWDHLNHAFHPVPNLKAVVALAEKPHAKRTGLAAFLNPDDFPYVAVDVRGWQFWEGKRAVVHDCYIRIPRLKEESIERLVKGERGSARLVFRIDLSRSKPPTFYVERIDRAGIATDNEDLTMDIFPLQVTDPPTDFRLNPTIRYDREATFRDLGKFTAQGYLERVEGGLRLRGEGFRIVLDPAADPGLQTLLEDIVLTPEERKALDEGRKVRGLPPVPAFKRVTLYLELTEVFPWGTRREPGPRQSRQEVGRAKVRGLKLGKFFAKT